MTRAAHAVACRPTSSSRLPRKRALRRGSHAGISQPRSAARVARCTRGRRPLLRPVGLSLAKLFDRLLAQQPPGATGSTMSIAPPAARPTTGVPHACASAMAIPKSSSTGYTMRARPGRDRGARSSSSVADERHVRRRARRESRAEGPRRPSPGDARADPRRRRRRDRVACSRRSARRRGRSPHVRRPA